MQRKSSVRALDCSYVLEYAEMRTVLQSKFREAKKLKERINFKCSQNVCVFKNKISQLYGEYQTERQTKRLPGTFTDMRGTLMPESNFSLAQLRHLKRGISSILSLFGLSISNFDSSLIY